MPFLILFAMLFFPGLFMLFALGTKDNWNYAYLATFSFVVAGIIVLLFNH